MSHRSSNVQRNRWLVGLMEIAPDDRVLEIGCGPGVALAAAAERLETGLAVGIDRSPVMVRQASRRNAAAIRDGRVVVVHAAVEDIASHAEDEDSPLHEPFDAILASNTVGFWPDPVVRLSELRALLRAGGRIGLLSQPRCPGATAETTAHAGRQLQETLTAAGFVVTRTETLDLAPPAVCVLARQASRATAAETNSALS